MNIYVQFLYEYREPAAGSMRSAKWRQRASIATPTNALGSQWVCLLVMFWHRYFDVMGYNEEHSLVKRTLH